jgi:hypothetical protein
MVDLDALLGSPATIHIPSSAAYFGCGITAQKYSESGKLLGGNELTRRLLLRNQR